MQSVWQSVSSLVCVIVVTCQHTTPVMCMLSAYLISATDWLVADCKVISHKLLSFWISKLEFTTPHPSPDRQDPLLASKLCILQAYESARLDWRVQEVTRAGKIWCVWSSQKCCWLAYVTIFLHYVDQGQTSWARKVSCMNEKEEEEEGSRVVESAPCILAAWISFELSDNLW